MKCNYELSPARIKSEHPLPSIALFRIRYRCVAKALVDSCVVHVRSSAGLTMVIGNSSSVPRSAHPYA